MNINNAYILEEEPDIVYMTDMKVTLYMNDGKVIVITSDNGSYNKVNYNCFFVGNVVATDDSTVITSENIDLLSEEDFASVYNNVVIKDEKGSLMADKIDYNFETKFYHVSMFNDERVKVKILEWVILKNSE